MPRNVIRSPDFKRNMKLVEGIEVSFLLKNIFYEIVLVTADQKNELDDDSITPVDPYYAVVEIEESDLFQLHEHIYSTLQEAIYHAKILNQEPGNKASVKFIDRETD